MEVGALLGSGGFARVWKARHECEGERVAVKVGLAATAYVREHFANEAAVLAGIGPPYVPALHGQGVLADGRPYLVMERLHGDSVASCLADARAPLGLEQAGRIAHGILHTLSMIHACGYLHLDLTPDNIFIPMCTPAPETTPGPALGPGTLPVTLIDFGLARRIDVDLPLVGWDEVGADHDVMVAGNVEYMAPEQLAGLAVLDVRTDIYAFGVILYELLTMRVPFVGDESAVSRGHRVLRPPHPDTITTVPEPLAALCLDCLRKDPAARPASAEVVIRRLGEAWQWRQPSRRRAPTGGTSDILAPGQQPVILLAVEFPEVSASVAISVRRFKGVVVRHDGRHALCAFAALNDDDPLQLALRAAETLREQFQARVAVHLAGLKVRPGRDGRPPRVYGTEVDRPESWMPSGNWNGVYLTSTAAEVLPGSQTTPAPSGGGFFVLVEDGDDDRGDEPRLVGRQDEINQAIACFEQVLRTRSPGLLSIVSDNGLGKSRMCRELGAWLQRAYPEVEAVLAYAGKRAGIELDALQVRLAELGGAGAAGTQRGDVRGEGLARGGIHPLGRALRRVAGKAPLAVIIDDVHELPDALLDALEYAALDATDTPLWLVVSAHPRFGIRRPGWGQRALRHEQMVLEPLGQTVSRDLAASLLHPVEYPPRTTLERLASWTAGNPQALVALVKTLFQTGIVRRGRQDGSWYVATAELERLPASPVGQWLAGRALAALPADVAACARMCAVLGTELWRDELEWVQNAAERAGTASSPIDTDIGLRALARAGLLEEVQPGLWRFSQASFQDAVYKLTGRRDRVRLHEYALGFWRSLRKPEQPDRTLAAIARHAEGASDAGVAAGAYIALGVRALARCRDLDADYYYTQALHAIDDEHTVAAVKALRGRGRARYRLHRIQDALDDLSRARAGAEALGDAALVAELLIDESTALDWAEKHERSARCVEQAGDVIASLAADADEVLRGRYLMARGRSIFRAGRVAEALGVLTEACSVAAREGDDQTHIVTLLLLGPLHVLSEALARAEQCFDEAIALCERSGDRFHLCVAYNNRSYLWLAQRSMSHIVADLGRAREIARESGWPVLERGAAHNLAEFLHWSGAHENALGLARRAYALRRFLPDPVPADALLLARILVACERPDEARAATEEARRLFVHQPEDAVTSIFLRLLDRCLDVSDRKNRSNEWEELLSAARNSLPDEEFLEVLYFRGRAAARAERWGEVAAVVDEAREKIGQCPVWQGPFVVLAERAARAADRDDARSDG
ncbi:serine/threonine-protein kinase PknK [Haliangium sp.]|uniref:serine/threonine-protein kinase n=1 Tax=Haliangium sp. TaxID=2663208 RepID=UPI003D0BC330